MIAQRRRRDDSVGHASIWVDDAGVPERMVWRGRRYRVSDQPTVWTQTSDWWSPLDAYEIGYGQTPLSIGGWRFQATSVDTGESAVFDVLDTNESWVVVRIYE